MNRTVVLMESRRNLSDFDLWIKDDISETFRRLKEFKAGWRPSDSTVIISDGPRAVRKVGI